MGYKKQERIDIGRQIFTGILTKEQAMSKYDVGETSIKNYIREYKAANEIPIISRTVQEKITVIKKDNCNLEAYQAMTKEELIQALILSKANELRAKKGYEVKGVGQKKEFISLNNKNLK
jgi:transposase